MENPGALAGATGADQVSTKDAERYRAPGYSASPAWTGADWARDRWAWKRAVKSDRRLSDAAKLLAVSLVDDFAKHDTAACTPGVELIGRCLAWSERKVQYALAELRKRCWIDVENGRGRGVRSRVLFRTGDGAVPFHPAATVVPLTALRAEGAQPQVEEKVQEPAPFAAEKVQERRPEKVQDRAPPIRNQRKNQSARTRATPRHPRPNSRRRLSLQALHRRRWPRCSPERRGRGTGTIGLPVAACPTCWNSITARGPDPMRRT